MLVDFKNNQVQLTSLQDLYDARSHKLSVVIPHWVGFRKPKPAAFVLNLSGEIIHRMLESGMYLYKSLREICKKGE